MKKCFPPGIGAVQPLLSQVLREPRLKADSMSRMRAVLVGTLISIFSGGASDTLRTEVTSIATDLRQPGHALVYFLQPDFSDAIVENTDKDISSSP